MRQGEKLYEELHCDLDQLMGTKHRKIFAAYQSRETWGQVSSIVKDLENIAHGSPSGIRKRFKKLIPEYITEADVATEPTVAAK